MAQAQKPDSVFQRNGRVHLYRRGCQFSRVLPFLECGSGENDCSNTGWTVPSQTEDCLATHSIRLFPLHFSSRASSCAIRFRFHYTCLVSCVETAVGVATGSFYSAIQIMIRLSHFHLKIQFSRTSSNKLKPVDDVKQRNSNISSTYCTVKRQQCTCV